jgi:hypothetical protein
MSRKDEDDVVERIASRFGLDRKTARAMYAEHFGRPCDDPVIDEELQNFFRNRSGEDVVVPASLALALILRVPPGKGRGKKRPTLETWKRRWRHLVVRSAENSWARKVEAGGRNVSKLAKHEAATDAHKKIYSHGLTVDTIKSRMNLARGKRDIEEK